MTTQQEQDRDSWAIHHPREAYTEQALAGEAYRQSLRSAAERAADPTPKEQALMAKALADVEQAHEATAQACVRLQEALVADTEESWARSETGGAWRVGMNAMTERERDARLSLEQAESAEHWARVRNNDLGAAVSASGQYRRTCVEAGKKP